MRASCVICSDLFDDVNSVVVAPCGHVFHEECIYRWIDRSKTCPECRKRVTFESVFKLYFNVCLSDFTDTSILENAYHSNEAKLRTKDVEIETLRDEKSQLQVYVKKAEIEAERLKQETHKLNSDISNLNLMLKHHKKSSTKVSELEKMNKGLMEKIEFYQNIRTVIDGTQKDIDDVLSSMSNNAEAMKQMATYCSLMKRELTNCSESKQQYRNEIGTLRKDNAVLGLQIKTLLEERDSLKEEIEVLKKENISLATKKRSYESSQESTSSCATVSYESPMPERLKHKLGSIDVEGETVTPVSERDNIYAFKQRNIKIIGRTIVAQPLKLPQTSENRMLSSIKKTPQDDSIIRIGYNGLGGHSKHIFKSKSSENFCSLSRSAGLKRKL